MLNLQGRMGREEGEFQSQHNRLSQWKWCKDSGPEALIFSGLRLWNSPSAFPAQPSASGTAHIQQDLTQQNRQMERISLAVGLLQIAACHGWLGLLEDLWAFPCLRDTWCMFLLPRSHSQMSLLFSSRKDSLSLECDAFQFICVQYFFFFFFFVLAFKRA